MQTTSISLLERLRQPAEQEAWERFVNLYTPLLCHWARKFGLQEPDVADFVQDIFTVLVQKLPEFHYDPHRRFRGWLWTLALNKFRERGRRKEVVAAGSTMNDSAGPLESDPALEFNEAEYRKFIVDRALQLMQKEFQPQTWKAFWEYVVVDRPGSEVAGDLGISIDSVYAAKSRVLRRLREELAGMLD